MGIEPIDFSKDEDDEDMPSGLKHGEPLQDVFQELLSPKSSLQSILRQDDIQADFTYFLKANQQCSRSISQGNTVIPPVLRSGAFVRNLASSFQNTEVEKKVKIAMEDIEDEDLQGIRTKEAWIVLGDFNEMLMKEERTGKRVNYKPAAEFIECIEMCQLEDVKYCGSYFTWRNKQQGNDKVYSKIDKYRARQRQNRILSIENKEGIRVDDPAQANGGAGFKKIDEWNVAALVKYVWAIANKEDNLWMKTWLSWRAESNQLSNLIRWIGKAKCTKFCKQVYLAAMASLVYQIWRARNDIVWNLKGANESLIIRKIKNDVKALDLKLGLSKFGKKGVIGIGQVAVVHPGLLQLCDHHSGFSSSPLRQQSYLL
uniref:Uncharacterized protein n=1 Tax=Cannabis sativa TaxID=3483 RepID=A0A803P118_CANSA